MNEVENQLDESIKALRTDQGREYLSKQFEELCTGNGTFQTINYSLYTSTKWCS